MPEDVCYLLDVNVLLALADRNHIHHLVVARWFYDDLDLCWALCAFTESGFLRISTGQRPGGITLDEATLLLRHFAQHPGYRYVPIVDDWHTLVQPFARKLYGSKQVTDAYLLGLSVRRRMTLVTMDRGILHLAGKENRERVLLLAPEPNEG